MIMINKLKTIIRINLHLTKRTLNGKLIMKLKNLKNLENRVDIKNKVSYNLNNIKNKIL